MSTNTSIPTESRANSDARQGLVLATLCAVTVLVIAFVAAINLAVPLLTSGSLHPSSTQLLWIVDSYVTVFACLVIPCGALGDRFGRKGVLTIGLILFAAGAAVSASSPTVAVMLIGRCVTGVGAACVLSNSLAILMHATPPQKRPRAIAIWASSTGFGGVAGNVGGGALLQTGSWRWLFVAVVPIALAGAAAVANLAPRTPRNHRGLDPVGTVLLTAATFGLLVGVIEGPESGWGSITVISAVALGLGSLMAASELLFNALRLAGVLYLVYLGVKLWRTPPPDVRAALAEQGESPQGGRALLRSLAVALSNPKSVLFFAAFLPQFIDTAQPQAHQYMVLGAIFVALDTCVMLAYAGAGTQAVRWLSQRSLQRLNRGCAAGMWALAAMLAFWRRPGV